MNRTIKNIVFLICGLFSGIASAQVVDDFTDTDFTQNPSWTGDVGLFAVVPYVLDETNFMLRSNSSGASDYYLSTENMLTDEVYWLFFFNLRFATSGSNYVDVYLMADNADLTDVQNGYFLRLGGTPDEISFYKVSNGTLLQLIDGEDGLIDSSTNNPFRIYMTRSADGIWDLLIDKGADGSFISGGSTTDIEITSTGHFGFHVVQSSAASPINSHFFDDIEIELIPIDETPPSLVSAQALSPNELLVIFSEPLLESSVTTTGNYAVGGGIGNPSTTAPADSNPSGVVLTFANSFAEGENYTVTVSGVSDLSGNVMGEESIEFFYFTTGAAEYKDVVFNELMIDPTPVVGLPEVEYIELFNAGESFLDLEGWVLVNTTTEKTLSSFVIPPGGYLLLCSTTDVEVLEPFGNVMGIPSFVALANTADSLTLINPEGVIIDVVNYALSWYGDTDKDDGGYALELINPYTACSGESNWRASDDPTGGTPGALNSVFDDTPDLTSPEVTSFQVISPGIVQINFSEIMDAQSLTGGSYDWNQGIQIVDIISGVNLMSVQLFITPELQTGVAYELILNGLFDCAGNQLEANTILTIQIGETPDLFDLRISEIMPDPNPVVGLPDGEYFELFNSSDKVIELQGLTLSGLLFANPRILTPGSYVLCSSATNEDLFTEDPNVYFIPGMSVTFLTNDGKELVLQNATGDLVDRVEYHVSWYGDPDKDDGGYALEIINPFTECSGQSNWTASQDPSGGTPGSQNSVYNIAPDNLSPEVVSFQVLAPELIQVVFTEVMDEESLLNGSYAWNQGISTLEASPSEDLRSVEITIDPALEIGIEYSLTINGPTDCIGNSIAENTVIEIQLGGVPLYHELLISEIMADPTPSNGLPEAEYFELYNPSQKVLDLQGSTLSGLVFENPKLLFPGEYLLCVGMNNQVEFLLYPEKYLIEGMSTTFLTNGGRELHLLNADGQEVDRVTYALDWYRDPAKEDGGYSLERINLNEPCRGAENWAASAAPAGGTPGAVNSINSEAPDALPPDIESAFVLDPQLIEIRFTEVIDSLSIIFTEISITPEIGVESIANMPPAYRSVLVQLASPLEVGVEYELILSGIRDCSGNELLDSSPFPLGLPEQGLPGEILINEILFNPRTGGSDFVEVVNVSSKIIGLRNWTLQNQSGTTAILTEDPLLIFPGQYLVLTASVQSIQQEYPQGRPENYVQMSSLPAFANTSGSVILTNDQMEVADRFDYLEDYHLSLINDLKGVSLERMSFTRPTNDGGNWTSAAERVGWATPGYLNSQYNPEGRALSNFDLLSEIFSPDNDGFEDVLQLNYLLDTPGSLATIGIYDRRGRRIKELSNNLVLGTEGTITWDGVADNGTKARLGPHIILIEVFDLTGRTEAFKIPFIVAGRLGG